MPPMQTLVLDTHYSVFREVFHPRLMGRVGGGATMVRRLYERPTYRFRVRNAMATQAEAEAFYGFALYHGPDRPFWFAGERWGVVSTPILVGFGTGSQTDFHLPNRQIIGSLVVSLDSDSGGPQPTLTAASGLLSFAAPPGNNVKITASYTCQYKVVFDLSGDILLTEEEFYRQLFRYEGIGLLEVVP
jgi:hypothetical protein